MQRSYSEIKTWETENARLFPDLMKLIDEGHTITIPLRGISMRPFLEDRRDTALLKKLENVKVGDPVLAEILPGKWVLHRIISLKDNDVILLGDGNLTPEFCQQADLRAEVVGFYRKKRSNIDSISGYKWRIYSWFWMHLLPVKITRRIVLALYRRWVRVFGAI